MIQTNAGKGDSHGYIETITVLFGYLINYNSRGKLSIKTKIDYLTQSSSTYGKTDK